MTGDGRRATGVGRKPIRGFAIAGAIAVATAAAALAVPPAPDARRPSPVARRPALQENEAYNGKFVFVRLRYDMGLSRYGGFGGGRGRGGDPPWHHDFPDAEYNLMQILTNITGVLPGAEVGNIIDVGDPELHKYPIAYMSEPGYWQMNDKEAANVREYLLKGGFMIFDDFPGEQWGNFEYQMKTLLPELQPVLLDSTHPVFHSFFEIDDLSHLFSSYRGTPVFYGYFEGNDPTKRLLVIANFLNDLGENWEYASTGFSMVDAQNEAFKFGVNYILYGLTH
jgi:hypothetical protein